MEHYDREFKAGEQQWSGRDFHAQLFPLQALPQL